MTQSLFSPSNNFSLQLIHIFLQPVFFFESFSAAPALVPAALLHVKKVVWSICRLLYLLNAVKPRQLLLWKQAKKTKQKKNPQAVSQQTSWLSLLSAGNPSHLLDDVKAANSPFSHLAPNPRDDRKRNSVVWNGRLVFPLQEAGRSLSVSLDKRRRAAAWRVEEPRHQPRACGRGGRRLTRTWPNCGGRTGRAKASVTDWKTPHPTQLLVSLPYSKLSC